MLFIPTLAHGILLALRYVDRGTEDLWKSFKGLVVGFILGMLLMLVAVFLFVHWIDGLIFFAALAFLIYVVIQLYMYIRDGFYMRPIWLNINRVIIFGLTITSFCISLGTDSFSMYAGASYSCLTLLFLMWSFAVFHFIVDFSEVEDRPVYYSITLFPIFKYDPKKNDVEDHYTPTSAWIAGVLVLLGWAFLTAH